MEEDEDLFDIVHDGGIKIGIVWRNDKEGKGAFWDHYTL